MLVFEGPGGAQVQHPQARLAGVESRALRRVRRTLATLGLLCALVAVMQPAWGAAGRKLEPRGVDVLVVLDVSRSMLARDQSPDRLGAAKREILALADRAAGDRIGLVAFAGDARLVIPLTRDRESFADLLARTGPLTVERGGTNLGVALEAALGALVGKSGEHEVLLLLTDGEDHEGRGLRVAERCRERGITVHSVGFGSPLGSKIAIATDTGEAFLRDRAGNEVISALDPGSLARLATATGGVYAEAIGAQAPLVELYEERIVPMARKAFEDDPRRERENRFQWPLAAAFCLWILQLCLVERTR